MEGSWSLLSLLFFPFSLMVLRLLYFTVGRGWAGSEGGRGGDLLP